MIQELWKFLSLHLFLLAGLAGLPLFVLARRRVFPHTPLLILLAGPAVVSLALLFAHEAVVVVLMADLAVAVLAIADLMSLPRPRQFSARRSTLRVASLGKPHLVKLALEIHRESRVYVEFRDDVPEQFSAEPAMFSFMLEGRSRAEVEYSLRARRRGAFELATVHLRVRSRWGCWRRYIAIAAHSIIHVYPDMQQLSEYAILARTNRLSLLGVRRSRKIGQDHDFERLRDYTLDDNYKHIDWRATARRNKLTVKDFQTSQSQRLIFLIDCGRMMNNHSSGMSLLDHALNSALMLSYVALRQGDSVGLLCFSDKIHTFVPPRGGMNQMNHLLHASFDRFPTLVESRYDLAFLHLATHCRKRSLIVLISNVIDEVNRFQVEQYLGAQVGRHLPMGILLRDRKIFQAAEQPADHARALFEAAAAAQILNWRQEVLSDLEHRGVLVLDVFPEDMTAPLVNRYLDIKARHLL